MSKLKLSSREIGSVCVFDLMGEATDETLQEAVVKIQRNIRRHRMQRIILNVQRMPSLEPIGLRKLLAACMRPQKSLLFGVSQALSAALETTYVPHSVKVCNSEKEIAENFGPFLLQKDMDGVSPHTEKENVQESIGYQLEQRRSKRMHVALPLDFTLHTPQGAFSVKGIATNISEGGMYLEFLDLEAAERLEGIQAIEQMKAQVVIFPSANFPEEYHLAGKVTRREIRKKQVGLGFEFTV